MEDGFDEDFVTKTSTKHESDQSNQIYFYNDVNRQTIFDLNKQIDAAEKHLKTIQIQYKLKTLPEIDIYISTDGGEVFPAMSTIDRIKYSEFNINTYVEGSVASCGTLLSIVGKKRYMRKNSFMLIHQISSGFWGNFSQFQDEIQNLELLMKSIKKLYIEHTKFGEEELDKLLKRDIYLNSDDCLKYGLVDHII